MLLSLLPTCVVLCSSAPALRSLRETPRDTPAAAEDKLDSRRAGHARMVALLAMLGERSAREDPVYGRARLEALHARLAELNDASRPSDLLRLFPVLGLEELFHGEVADAVKHLEQARELMLALPEEQRGDLTRLTYNLAVTCLRLGETQNCVARHTSVSCLMPIEGTGVHVDQDGSRRAIRYLNEVLAATEPTNDTHLGARWLLNLAYMTLGEWPDGVPAAERIARSVFTSDEPFARFHDVAGPLGLDLFTTSGGVAVEDYDGDGRPDLFVTTWDPRGQARFFAHRADGAFVDRTVDSGLSGIVGGLNLTQADYDSDGDVDLFVLRGGWQLGIDGQVPNSLLENQGPQAPGQFLDVTFAVGLGEVHYPTQSADWADVDLDGDLDLYIGNEASSSSPFPCQLFLNDGQGTFTDGALAGGVSNMRMAKGVSFGDIDGDRDPDLYVSNYFGPNRLYQNKGDGTFEDVAAERGVTRPIDSFPAWFWDFDNDGALDLYVATYYQSTGEARLGPVVASHLGLPGRQDLNKLYKGDGRGHFRDVAPEQGLDLFTVVMGASFGDLDNDGYPDFYLGTGYPFYDGLVPNVMYWNRGGKRFADVTTAGGFGHLQKGHGIAFADLDLDGDQDVYAEMGGAYPGDAFGNALFENPGTSNHWVRLRLEGRRSVRAAIGARVRLQIREGLATRSIYQTVGQHGSFGNSPFELHVGLGQAERIEVLEIHWPSSAEPQVLRDLPVEKRLSIVEGEPQVRIEALTPLPFLR